jgi:hypothetical protein
MDLHGSTLNLYGGTINLRASTLNRCGKSLLCLTALCMLASNSARAADLDPFAAAQRVAFLPPTTSAGDAAQQCAYVAPQQSANVGPQQSSFVAPQPAANIAAQQSSYAAAQPCACDAAQSCACAAQPCCTPLSVYVPHLTPGFTFNAGFLLLQPGADNLGYATVTTFLPLGNPQWQVVTLDPTYQPGFNVGARYNFGSSANDLQINWDHLRTSDSSALKVSDPATQWVSPFNQTGPSTSESSNEVGVFHLKATDAHVDFDYDMLNIDLGQTINVGANTQFRFFAGLSCVRLQEQIVSTFYNNPNIDPIPPVIAIPDPDLKYITLNNTSTYNGVGPRLGFSTAYNLPRGFTFVSSLSGAVLAGQMTPAQYSFTAVFDDVNNSEAIRSPTVSQVVYATDAKLGLGYAHQMRNCSVLSVECGFRAALFVNPFATYETSTNVLPLDIGSLSTNSMRHTPSNFTLNGFYANASLQW